MGYKVTERWSDWKEVEQKLYCTIPSCVKNFYKTVNGGLTIGNLFLLNGDEQKQLRNSCL